MKKNSRRTPFDSQAVLARGILSQQRGDLDGAVACYAEVLRHDPRDPDALHLSGVIANQRSQYVAATELIEKAIGVRPHIPMYYVNLANAQENLGKTKAAADSLRRAIGLDPSYASALYNLGNLLVRNNEDGEAMRCYDRAIVSNPSHLAACLALGRLLLKQKQVVPAIQLARMALKIEPASSKANSLLIDALLLNKNYGAALERVEISLAADPRDVVALGVKVRCLKELVRIDEAIATLRVILRLAPEDVAMAVMLGGCLAFSGDVAEALTVFNQLADRYPGNTFAVSSWLFYLNYDESRTARELLNLHRGSGKAFAKPGLGVMARNTPGPQERLKIAYVSADFRTHSVAFFIEPVIEHHDRKTFEVFAYYLGSENDAVTERIRGKVDLFRELSGQSPEEIARTIAEDGIDIAIDLGAHTTDRLLDAFSYRPAPVQITWLGYPNTTGVAAIDYRITDAIADPVGDGDLWNSEKLLRLPDCFHCYRPEQNVSFDEVPPSVRNGSITFGSFNVLPKLSPSCAAAWVRIINAVPNSRLLIKTRFLGDSGVRQRLIERFAALGLSGDRLVLDADQSEWSDHMQRYREVDIALDTFPYNGTTTTCEALWMGVPVITHTGDRHASRVGASLLTAIGHPELVAPDVEGYISRAIELARRVDLLGGLHQRIHRDLASSPLCDAARFVSHLEAAYRHAWANGPTSSA